MQQTATTPSEHSRAVMTLGMPLVLSHLAQFGIHMTDTIMLGWYSVTTLAASTIAGTFFFLVFIVGSGFAQAITPLVAAAAEEGDDQQVRRATRMGLWLSVIYGAVMMVPFFWTEAIMIAFGQDPIVAALSQDYLQIVAFALIPALLTMAFKSFLAALEHTGIILWTTIGTAILNGFINYALIFGNWGAPELGIQGAAIASLLMNLLNVALLLIFSLVKTRKFKLMQNVWAPDADMMRRVFALGWPIGLTSLAEGGLFSASAVMIGWLGPLPLAAHGIAIQLASLTFMVHIGFSQAATVRAGRALGRQDEASLRLGGKVAITLSAIFAFATMFVFILFPEPLISAFIDPDEPAKAELLSIGIALLACAGLFQVVDGLQVMALGLLRGVQDTQVPMIMATFSYWVVGMPVSYILAFPLGLGGVGLWLGLVVGLSVAAVLLLWRFWTRSVYIGQAA